VVEVGSGAHGLIFYFGAENGIGVDPLAVSYGSLFPRWQRRAHTIAAVGESLPFADQSFDVVLCDNVVDHAESPRKIAGELARILVSGGLLYFTVNIHHQVYALAAGVHSSWRAAGVRYEVGPFADHTTHLTLTAATSLFKDLPLKILSAKSDIDEARVRARKRPARHIGDRLKRVFFKNALYEVVARRV
jgi:SAM-dependent methyltransferase